MEPGRGAADILDTGPDRRRVPLPRSSRWALVALAVLLVAVGLRHAAPTEPVRAAAAPTLPPSAIGPAPPVAVVTLGHSLLQVTAGWELFARGSEEVVRIEPARGRITQTAVPPLPAGAPASFVVTADRAVVRPLDRAPGYVVPDGRPVRSLPAALGGGGPVLPGPSPGTVWVRGGSAMVLRAVADGRVRASVPLPEPAAEVAGDGAGGLVVRSAGRVYAATPAGMRRITAGALLAVGPSRLVTLDCDAAHRCRPYVVDRVTGARRPVPGTLAAGGPRGVVAPDGRTAAMFRPGRDGTPVPYLLDLLSGASHALGVTIARPGEGCLVWSPDSRWLFTTDSAGMIVAVDRATAAPTEVGVALTAPAQLAVRAG